MGRLLYPKHRFLNIFKGFLILHGYAEHPVDPTGLPENGNVEAGFVEAELAEPVFPGALARLQIGNS